MYKLQKYFAYFYNVNDTRQFRTKQDIYILEKENAAVVNSKSNFLSIFYIII